MQLSFQRPILHQFINNKPCVTMNAVPQKRDDIGMLDSTYQVNLVLQPNI